MIKEFLGSCSCVVALRGRRFRLSVTVAFGRGFGFGRAFPLGPTRRSDLDIPRVLGVIAELFNSPWGRVELFLGLAQEVSKLIPSTPPFFVEKNTRNKMAIRVSGCA